MTIFERIKETAKLRGISLTELSKRSGLGDKTVYKWRDKEPSASRLKAVAEVLNVSVDYLLGETDEKKPHSAKNGGKGKIDLFEVPDEERNELLSAGGNAISDEDWAIIKAILARYPRKKD